MSQDQNKSSLRLEYFTFASLYLCQTRVSSLRGEWLVTIIKEWYLPLIRAGSAVPLSFIVDLATLLVRPSAPTVDRWKEPGVSPDVQTRALRYYRVLQALRRQPVFEEVSELLQEVNDVTVRHAVVKVFLGLIVAAIAKFQHAYSFDTRRFEVLKVAVRNDNIYYLLLGENGETRKSDLRFGNLASVQREPEFNVLAKLLDHICEFFENSKLEQLVSPVSRLVIDIVARSPAGMSRTDYRFLDFLLGRDILEDVDQFPPHPKMVEELVPTNEFVTDGNTGGYIDVTRKAFNGSFAEILPAELAFWPYQVAMMEKLFNRGVLSFVRENIEHLERELRVLVCFVVDNSPAMLHAPAGVHADFGPGLTTYMRARAMSALMLQDLVRFFPRHDVQLDFAWYLWSTQAARTCSLAIDVGQWPATEAEDRTAFLRGLVDRAPPVFYLGVNAVDARGTTGLELDPLSCLIEGHARRNYHCRHIVYFTSNHTAAKLLAADKDPRLQVDGAGQDSICVVTCDLEHSTVGVVWPNGLFAAADEVRSGRLGQMSEERLRSHFIDTVIAKGARKSLNSEYAALLDEMS